MPKMSLEPLKDLVARMIDRKRNGKADFADLAKEGRRLLVDLRPVMRNGGESAYVIRTSEAKEAASVPCEVHELRYQCRHVDHEIDTCLSFREGPERNEWATVEDLSHADRMERLETEVEARKALLAELDKLRREKEQVAQSLDSKKRALSDIDEVLEAASNQLTTDLHPWTPKAVIEPVIERLPAPLKALYQLLLTVRNEEKLEVILRHHIGGVKRRPKRMRTELQAASVMLQLFRDGDKQCLSVEFSFSPSQGIVTAKCDDPSNNIVLAALFPGDTGREKGYRWVQALADWDPDLCVHRLPVREQYGLFPKAVVNRLFECEAALRSLRSQLESLKNKRVPVPLMEDLFLVTQQSARITSFSEVVPKGDGRGPKPGVINLMSDGEEEGELKEAAAPKTQQGMDQVDLQNTRQLHRVFRITLQKGDLELEARICIFITYPGPPPIVEIVALRQLVTSYSGGRQHVIGQADLGLTNAMAFLGQQANIGILKALQPDQRAAVLSCQVRMLTIAFDEFANLHQAMTTVKKGTAKQVDVLSLKGMMRGRDRRFNRLRYRVTGSSTGDDDEGTGHGLSQHRRRTFTLQ